MAICRDLPNWVCGQKARAEVSVHWSQGVFVGGYPMPTSLNVVDWGMRDCDPYVPLSSLVAKLDVYGERVGVG